MKNISLVKKLILLSSAATLILTAPTIAQQNKQNTNSQHLQQKEEITIPKFFWNTFYASLQEERKNHITQKNTNSNPTFYNSHPYYEEEANEQRENQTKNSLEHSLSNALSKTMEETYWGQKAKQWKQSVEEHTTLRYQKELETHNKDLQTNPNNKTNKLTIEIKPYLDSDLYYSSIDTTIKKGNSEFCIDYYPLLNGIEIYTTIPITKTTNIEIGGYKEDEYHQIDIAFEIPF